MATPLVVSPVMPLELAEKQWSFITLQLAEKDGTSVLQAEEGNLRVAQHTAKVDSEITGQKQEVSEEGTKILYGYSSERPQGVPQGFKVFARLDRNARVSQGYYARRSQLG